jgi:hypothetical protein
MCRRLSSGRFIGNIIYYDEIRFREKLANITENQSGGIWQNPAKIFISENTVFMEHARAR